MSSTKSPHGIDTVAKAENEDAIQNGTSHNTDSENGRFKFSDSPSLEDIRRIHAEFCDERNWNQFHTPRNLLLAMVGEVGELAELFQWKGEVKPGLPGWSKEQREAVSHEMSDVLIYLIRLADKCEIDLSQEALKKIKLNGIKYPASKVFGSSKKYNEYQDE